MRTWQMDENVEKNNCKVMRRRIIIAILAIMTVNAYCENGPKNVYPSVEICGGYFYIIDLPHDHFYFNYAVAVMPAFNFNRFKISFGGAYSTNTYSQDFDINDSTQKGNVECRFKYVAIPIVFSYKFINKENYSLSGLAGIFETRLVDYKKTSTYQGVQGEKKTVDTYFGENNIGYGANIGIMFSRRLFSNFWMNVSSCFIYHNYNRSLNLQIGLEYRFTNFSK